MARHQGAHIWTREFQIMHAYYALIKTWKSVVYGSFFGTYNAVKTSMNEGWYHALRDYFKSQYAKTGGAYISLDPKQKSLNKRSHLAVQTWRFLRRFFFKLHCANFLAGAFKIYLRMRKMKNLVRVKGKNKNSQKARTLYAWPSI